MDARANAALSVHYGGRLPAILHCYETGGQEEEDNSARLGSGPGRVEETAPKHPLSKASARAAKSKLQERRKLIVRKMKQREKDKEKESAA